MTRVGRGVSRGSLSRRMFMAFLAVALVAIAIVSGAALVGSQRGISANQAADREVSAQRCAAVAASAFAEAGDWTPEVISVVEMCAAESGARLVGRLDNPGARPMGAGIAAADVRVNGSVIGSVRLSFEGAAGSGTEIAWAWIAAATIAAAILAGLGSWWVSRRITRPLRHLEEAVRAFGAGDRHVRARVTGSAEVANLAEAFDGMAEHIDRAERARRDLASDVAHEVRTPLSALQAGLEEIRDGLVEPSVERLSALHDQSLRLSRVVDDLGRLAEAEAPDVDIRWMDVDLAAAAADSLAAARPLLDAAGIAATLEIEDEVVVHADADRLGQILGNLLANVARHCSAGDRVTVRVARAPGRGIVSVVDDGPGMNEVDAQRAFERFHRASGAQEAQGTGLGLAVVHALALAMGGDVRLESEPGVGTRITLVLALAGDDPRTSTTGPARLGARPVEG